MHTLRDFLSKRSRHFWIALGLVLVAVITIIDYFTEPDLLILYLIPIILVDWFAGEKPGVILAVASAISWFAADVLSTTHDTAGVVPYWNLAVRSAIFLTVTYMLSGLLATRKRHEELMHFIIHDLRSPLTNVLTGLQTLRQMRAIQMDESEQEMLDMALISSNRMLTLINSLLDLPRLEHRKMPVQRQEVSVDEVVNNSLAVVALWAAQNRVQMVYEADPQVSTVIADPDITTRVLVNLLSNALKYSPPDSTVTIRTRASEGETVTFSVADQGPGIPPEWVDKVFDKYAQVEARKEGASTGLGLTFCQLAVEAQKGRIWIESELGKGTTVLFTLPAGKAKKALLLEE
ncbi:Adaptive-response sensory-kinase SasA [bacterium HR16]|nr:Adaptive-response sensory-kinase SasA [bacterium HR16]